MCQNITRRTKDWTRGTGQHIPALLQKLAGSRGPNHLPEASKKAAAPPRMVSSEHGPPLNSTSETHPMSDGWWCPLSSLIFEVKAQWMGLCMSCSLSHLSLREYQKEFQGTDANFSPYPFRVDILYKLSPEICAVNCHLKAGWGNSNTFTWQTFTVLAEGIAY
jgi:hypothetical protein